MRLPEDRGIVLLVCLFLLTLPLVTARIYAIDEIQYFAPLRSAWKDNDLDYRNDYTELLKGRPVDAVERGALLSKPTATGRAVNYAGIGCALMWVPFFALAEIVARVGGWPADGFSYPYIAAVCYGSSLYAFLALLLLYDIARREVSPKLALVGTLLAWWATALPFYMYVTPPMSHATSLFGVTLFLWLWWRWRGDAGVARWAVLGVVVGLITLIREQNVLFLLLPGVSLARDWVAAWRAEQSESGLAPRHQWARVAALAAGFVLSLAPQLVVWRVLFGRWGPPAERVSYLELWPSHFFQVLFSSNHGLLSWHPVWLLGVVGLVLYARRNPRLGWSLFAVFLAQLLFLSSVGNWSGGMAFGQRRLVECLFVVVIGTAVVFDKMHTRPAVLVWLLLVWLNLSMLIQFGTGMIPRSGPVSWRALLRNHFVEVPSRTWDVAWRYLGDRGSFMERQ